MRRSRDRAGRLRQMRKATIAAFLTCSILPTTAALATDNVQALLTQCTEKVASLAYIGCLMRIGGISDALAFNGALIALGDNSELLAKFATCPKGSPATYGADVQVFVNWAHNHPERWGDPDLVGVATALRETWPCHGGN
jgi:hypothetical protein